MTEGVIPPRDRTPRAMPPLRESPSEEALIREAQRGDVGAFEQLVRRHAGLVFSIARSRMPDHGSAEDLFQEVFLRVHLNLHQLRDPSRFAPWLARLTRNLAAEWLRRGQRRSQLVPMVPMDEAVSQQVPDTQTEGAREIMEREEQITALHGAIDRLPPDLRELVWLHSVEGMSQVEISTRLGVTQATVSRRLRHALDAMRAHPPLREMAPALRTPGHVVTRTVGLIAVASAMSGAARAALVTAAAASAPSVKIGSLGPVSILAAKLAAGGTAMGMGKAAIAVATLAVAGFVVHGQLSEKGDGGTSSPVTQAWSAAPADADVSLSPVTQAWSVTSAEPAVSLSGPVELVWRRDLGEEHRIRSVERVTLNTRPDTSEIPPQHREGLNEREYVHRVTEGSADGSVIVELVEFDAEGSPTGVRQTMWIDPVGRITRIDEFRSPLDESQRLFMETVSMALSGFPEGPISPGESWTRQITNPRFPEAQVVAVSTLERLEERSGQVVAVVQREMDLEIPGAIPWPSLVDNDPGMQAEMSGVRAHTTMESHLLLDGMIPIHEVYQVVLGSNAHVTGQTSDGPLDVTGSITVHIDGEMNLLEGD
jgi:RNA polymerase sigma-70 factor, ECF subfamily